MPLFGLHQKGVAFVLKDFETGEALATAMLPRCRPADSRAQPTICEGAYLRVDQAQGWWCRNHKQTLAATGPGKTLAGFLPHSRQMGSFASGYIGFPLNGQCSLLRGFHDALFPARRVRLARAVLLTVTLSFPFPNLNIQTKTEDYRIYSI